MTAAAPFVGLADPRGDWAMTFSGRRFYPAAPHVDAGCLDDIAHSLAHQCRFAGHCFTSYSVAQHSVLVSQLCSPENQLVGLLHDATEAYLQDIIRPLKKLLGQAIATSKHSGARPSAWSSASATDWSSSPSRSTAPIAWCWWRSGGTCWHPSHGLRSRRTRIGSSRGRPPARRRSFCGTSECTGAPSEHGDQDAVRLRRR